MLMVVSENDILNYWATALVRFDGSVLAMSPIPDSAKQFLQTVGVPTEFKDGLNWNIRIKPLSHLIQFQRLGAEYIIFGEGEGDHICFKVPTGEVVAIDDDGSKPLLINTSVQSLVAYEFLFCKFIDLAPSNHLLSNTRRLETLEKLKEQLMQQDAAALADPENWWSTFVEELESFDG